MIARGARLSELVAGFEEFPQVLVNVKVARKAAFDEFPEIGRAFGEIRAALGGERPPRPPLFGHRAPGPGHGRGAGPGRDRKTRERLASILRKHLA